MESAITVSLQCLRTRPTNVPPGFAPGAPASMARMAREVTRVVMAYLGIQYPIQGSVHVATFIENLRCSFALPHGPSHFDFAHCIDETGLNQLVGVAYWTDISDYTTWWAQPEVTGWWRDPARVDEGVGYFRKVLSPRLGRFETMYAARGMVERIARVAQGPSGEILEHGYWGASRDRLPANQIDALDGRGSPSVVHPSDSSGWLAIKPRHNVAVIRSDQVWRATSGNERKKYLSEIAPTLKAGMDSRQGEWL